MNSSDPRKRIPPAYGTPLPPSPVKQAIPATPSVPQKDAENGYVPPVAPPENRNSPVGERKPVNSGMNFYQAQQAAKAAKTARIEHYCCVFGLLALAIAAMWFALWAGTLGRHNTLYSDRHAFRQTQTAINCFYMLQTGYTLDYQTPVLGPPWHAPFEFPAYQWAVVWGVHTFHDTLDASGRGVSLAFYLLTLIPVFFILQAMKVAPAHRLIFLILMLVSPFYLFWSRAFMMESTAVFFSMACIACVMQYDWRRSCGSGVLPIILLLVPAVAFGVLAAMVKITTFFPFGLAVTIFVARDGFRLPLPEKLPWRRIIEGLVVLGFTVGIPLAAAIAWTAHADKIKALSPIATYMQSSSPQMHDWNFGTNEQRFSTDVWSVILGRCGTLVSEEWILWLGWLAAIIITRRRWKESIALLLAFFCTPLVFVNLHHEHDYYMYANGLFLLGAVGFSLLAIFESRYGLYIGFAVLLITGFAAYSEFSVVYYPMMVKNNTQWQGYFDTIDNAADPDSVVIYMGLDWNPLWPYCTQRRSLMIPAWKYLTKNDVRKALELLKGTKVGCIVEIEPVGNIDRAYVIDTMKNLGLDTSREIRLH